MADSAPVLIWIAEFSKGRHWFNQVWLDFTGRSAEQESGFGWSQNVHEDDLARCLQAYAEGFDTRRPFRHEYRLRRADGMARWIIEQANPLFEGPAGAFSGYIGSCVDITESKQLQSDREETLKVVNEVLKAPIPVLETYLLKDNDFGRDPGAAPNFPAIQKMLDIYAETGMLPKLDVAQFKHPTIVAPLQ